MKKIILIISIFLMCVIGYGIAGPYLTISDIKIGVIERDSERLSKNIEFSTLRQNMKDQLNVVMMKDITSELENNPFAGLAAVIVTKMVDSIIDTFITPAGLATIMEGKIDVTGRTKINESPKKEELFKDAKYSFDSIDSFSIRIPNNKDDEIRFILKREILSWKLVNIIIPMDKGY